VYTALQMTAVRAGGTVCDPPLARTVSVAGTFGTPSASPKLTRMESKLLEKRQKAEEEKDKDKDNEEIEVAITSATHAQPVQRHLEDIFSLLEGSMHRECCWENDSQFTFLRLSRKAEYSLIFETARTLNASFSPPLLFRVYQRQLC
jgi:hypothetical protein